MARGEKQCVGSGYSGNTSPGAAAIIMALKRNRGKLTKQRAEKSLGDWIVKIKNFSSAAH